MVEIQQLLTSIFTSLRDPQPESLRPFSFTIFDINIIKKRLGTFSFYEFRFKATLSFKSHSWSNLSLILPYLAIILGSGLINFRLAEDEIKEDYTSKLHPRIQASTHILVVGASRLI